MVLKKDHIASLYSHGQVPKQICCFPGVLCDAGDAPTNLLGELNSHVVSCASRLESERAKDVGAGQPSVYICLSSFELLQLSCRCGTQRRRRELTSQAMSLPLAHCRRVVPSGRLPSSRIRQTGSSPASIWAHFSALIQTTLSTLFYGKISHAVLVHPPVSHIPE